MYTNINKSIKHFGNRDQIYVGLLTGWIYFGFFRGGGDVRFEERKK